MGAPEQPPWYAASSLSHTRAHTSTHTHTPEHTHTLAHRLIHGTNRAQMEDGTNRAQMVTRLSDSLGSSLINDQEKAGAPLSGMLISWLSLFDFDERKKLTEERWKTCAEALMFETSSAEWELLRQRHGDANSQGLDISLLSSWFANEHSVVLDRMLRRLMRTTARAPARSPPSPITPAPEQAP